MKKVLVMMLMAVAVAMPSKAQVKFGLTAGLNMSNVNAKDLGGSVKSRAGFFVGPTVKFSLPIVGLGIDASAVYDQREGKVGEGDYQETIKSQSIQIPINVRYGAGLGDLAEIFLFAGPQFGFNVGSNKTWAQDAAEWSLKSSNLSANVGIGATVLGHLQAKINYNFALGKTGEVKPLDAAKSVIKDTGSAKFSAWQISLAYWF